MGRTKKGALAVVSGYSVALARWRLRLQGATAAGGAAYVLQVAVAVWLRLCVVRLCSSL